MLNHAIQVRAILLAFCLFLVAELARAYIIAGSMGRDPQSSHGQCLPKKDLKTGRRIDAGSARVILQRNGVTTTSNIASDELIALAVGIQRVEELHGRPFAGVKGAHFIYTESARVWNQTSGPIRINRRWSNNTGMNTENVGMLMHELGHYVGNNKSPLNSASYLKYFRAVPERCLFSWYAAQSRNEEYADVFATFIVNPENLLRFGSVGCRKAYEFFRKKVFTKGQLKSCRSSL